MSLNRFTLGVVVVAACLSAACAKKVAVAKPAPAPAAVAPAPEARRAEAPAPRPAVAQKEAAPASRYPDKETLEKIDALLSRIQDAYFDYDKHMLRTDAQATLADDAKTLAKIIKQYPDFKLSVQGFCDERGSAEYNLALGDARAMKAKEYLVDLGLPAAQMTTVSFGKENPVCTDHDEACWQKNRRAHLTTADNRNGR